MNRQTATDELWKTKPHVIRNFVESRPLYEKLSEEVAFIVETALRKAGIEFAAVTFRAKTLESFCEKVARKKYADPLKEITDFGGVRVVYLYKSDKHRVESIIEKQFKTLEKIDTLDAADPEKFGYGALHYLANLAGGSSGARYDELRSLTCEIQVRTVLQDGWAIIAHHLSYKQEADVPVELRRKLNALSGLFETADDQFDRVRDERADYSKKVKEVIASDTETSLNEPLNLDNLVQYLAWKFPNREHDSRDDISTLLAELRSNGCEKLSDVDQGISRAIKAVEAQEAKYPPGDQHGKETTYSGVGVTRVSFHFLNKEYRTKQLKSRELEKHYEEFAHLIGK